MSRSKRRKAARPGQIQLASPAEMQKYVTCELLCCSGVLCPTMKVVGTCRLAKAARS